MLKWAQRRDRLFITLDAQDIAGEVVSLSPGALRFTGDGGGGKRYELQLSFYHPVDPQHPVRCLFPAAAACGPRSVRVCFARRPSFSGNAGRALRRRANGSTLAGTFV